jgi:trigger factor
MSLKTTISQPQSWQRTINVEIPTEDFESAYRVRETKYRKQVHIDGFRQGKVPAEIIKARFGASIRAETVEDLVQKSYQDACKEHSIQPVSEAKITNLVAEEGKPLTFSIEAQIDPVIDIKGYQKLKIRPDVKKVKSAQVDEVLENLRSRIAETKDVDRASKKGDLLTIEYLSVSIDGEERKNFQNPQHPVELGAGTIKEFDKGLLDARAGETVNVTVKFPKDYGDETVAGKKGEFSIKVNKVQEKILPEVNEEFLKKVGDYKSVDDLKARILEDLEKQELDKSKNEAYNKAIEKLIKDNPFDVPPARVEMYIDYMVEELGRYRRKDEPVPSREEIAAKHTEDGIRLIKRHRIIDAIAEKENIKATQSEVDARIKSLADMYNQPFEDLKKSLRENGTTVRIRGDIREQKTLDYLIGELTPEATPVVEASQGADTNA